MHFHVRDNWRLFVGLGLSVFAVFIALLGIDISGICSPDTAYRGDRTFSLVKTLP
jgi:hypothetical protein